MKKLRILFALIFCSGSVLQAQGPQVQAAPDAQLLARGQNYMQAQAAAFEENKGQFQGEDASKVHFAYRDANFSLFLLPTRLAYQFRQVHYPEGYRALGKFAEPEEQESMQQLEKDIRNESYRMDIELLGANPKARISSEGKSADYLQYYKHNAHQVHKYSRITYHDIYPNIDWIVYKSEQGELKYDFVIRPGGKPEDIRLKTHWVEELQLNADGGITLKNRMGRVREKAPVSLQNEKKIATRFVQEGDILGFELGAYEKEQVLVIDPNLVWASYYGGANNETGESCTVDADGNVYLAGTTVSTNAIAAGGHQMSYGGGNFDAFLVKFSSTGTRLWASYYGGADRDEGKACVVDANGNIYLSGTSRSTNAIASAGYQNSLGGGLDAFLVKFDSTGTRLWATYYGGTGNDEGTACAVDADGNVYLVGRSNSTTDISFGGHQNSFGGGAGDAFVAKFTSTGMRIWASYYGGSALDVAMACALDGSGNIHLAGYTLSSNAIGFGAFQNNYAGGRDAFLVKFDSSGARLWGSYYGGSSFDEARACAVDADGNAYITGFTLSADIAIFGGHQDSSTGGADAFLAKFDSNGGLRWASYYGGSIADFGNACTTDAEQNVYIAGHTNSTTDIAFGDGHQSSFAGNFDAYIAKFDSSGTRLWASYYGGADRDEGRACAVDADGNIYLAGPSNSADAIFFAGFQDSLGGGDDAFLAKFRCSTTSSTLNETACESYSLNGQIYTASGTYTQSLSNAAGCDSTVVLNLTINALPDTTVIQVGDSLRAQQAGASYQWLDCDNGNTAVAGATGQSFLPARSGNYALVVRANACSDSSACQNIILSNIALRQQQQAYRLYPNPSAATVFYEFSNREQGKYSIDIFDALGRRLKHLDLQAQSGRNQVELELGSYPSGIYLIRIEHSDGRLHTERILRRGN